MGVSFIQLNTLGDIYGLHFMEVKGSERPLKRAKVHLSDLNQLSEESSHLEFASTSLGDPMAEPQSLPEDGETIGPKGVIKKNEFVKIITGALYSLGFDKTGALLEKESGIQLHSLNFNLLKQQAMNGQWEDSLETLQKIDLVDETIKRSVSFLILEQNFLELLKEDKCMEALGILKNRMVPLSINSGRVHELAASIISPISRLELGICLQDTDMKKIRRTFLEKLQKLLPAEVIIPESRLEHLVEQALDVQRDACVYHNALESEMSLYTDHDCGRSQIPSQTMQVRSAL